MTIDELLCLSPIIPVLTINDASRARVIAQTLVAGGLSVLEVTLRTPAALDAIREMAKVEGVRIGAGTVLNVDDIRASHAAGAQFVVSPGLSERLIDGARSQHLPILAGVSTASDIMRGLELGLTQFKFFPAETVRGVDVLKALSAPFKQCRFCPTGGITEKSAGRWLDLEAVACVGGSWIVPRDEDRPSEIFERARRAANLRSHAREVSGI